MILKKIYDTLREITAQLDLVNERIQLLMDTKAEEDKKKKYEKYTDETGKYIRR